MKNANTYGIVSDTHHHNWSAFSTTLSNGLNSRLNDILEMFYKVAKATHENGGSKIYHCGDLFHVRGSIAPSVLNPTLDMYKRVMSEFGLEIRILAGNHDLESKHSERLSSAITALEGIGCEVVNDCDFFEDDKVAMIAWIANVDDLKKSIQQVAKQINEQDDIEDWTLMLHAPIDNVITGLPNHGLTDEWLASVGFKNVLSGHYHNHKNFGNGVYSVGALTHQTWSDINSKAGYMICKDGELSFYESETPKFVEITYDNKDEIKKLAKGNFVRMKIGTSDKSDIEKVRLLLEKCGALGSTIISTAGNSDFVRTKSSVKTGETIENAVESYVLTSFDDKSAEVKNEIVSLCIEVLAEARSNLGGE